MSITFNTADLSDDNDLAVNLSNRNARWVLAGLGIEPESCGEIDPEDLMDKVRWSDPITERVPDEKVTPNFIDFGLPANYFVDVYARLFTLAQHAEHIRAKVTWA